MRTFAAVATLVAVASAVKIEDDPVVAAVGIEDIVAAVDEGIAGASAADAQAASNAA